MREALALRSDEEAQGEINRLIAAIEHGEDEGWEAEHAISIAQDWGFDVEAVKRRVMLAAQIAAEDRAEKKRAAIAEAEAAEERKRAEALMKKFLGQIQPTVISPQEEQPAEASDDRHQRLLAARLSPIMAGVVEAALLARVVPQEDEAEPQAEGGARPEVDAEGLGSFADEEEDSDANPAVLSPGAPYDNARVYARRYCFNDGFLAVRYWHEDFWEWDGRAYQKMGADALRSSVYRFLDESLKIEVVKGGEAQSVRFRPKAQHVNELIDGLKAGVGMPADWYPPMWLDTRQKAPEVLVFANVVLDIRTGDLWEPTPRLWAHGTVGYDWNPEAQCPRWAQFLEEIFPGDQESQDFIEEFLGYCMTEDTRFQKGALLIGPPRSGKSTVLKILEKLVGPERYAGSSFNTWMKGEKALQHLLGKNVLAMPDVRLRPGKWWGSNYDPGGLDHASVEMLLKLTAGDKVTIPRMYKTAYEAALPLKVILVSNEVPNFNDPVLVTRFVKVLFEQSFLDREDVTLMEQLEAELPGIAIRAVEGYWRAVHRGRFVQPTSGLKLKTALEDEIDPFAKFVRDTFVIDAAATVKIGTVETRWGTWCENNGRPDLSRSIKRQHFLSHLRRIPGLEQIRSIKPHGGPRHYTFLRIRQSHEKEEEA